MTLDRTGEPIEPDGPCPYGCRNGWLGITAEDPYPDVMRACPECRKPEKHAGITPTHYSDKAAQAIERADRNE